MAIKDVEFDILLKSTDRQFQFERDVVFTNDRNSVRVIFNIKDMTTSDLSGATAQVILYMHDGSFYQIPNGDVIKDGTSFKYVLKGNEGKHRGVVKAQLVVMFTGDSDLASRKCEFEIDTGLDNVVAAEVMIKDWTTLLREARDYIEEYKQNEAARIQSFNQTQTERATQFSEAQSERQAAYDQVEEVREQSENERVSNEEERVSKEQERVDNENERISNEANRQAAETTRAEFYETFDQKLDNNQAVTSRLDQTTRQMSQDISAIHRSNPAGNERASLTTPDKVDYLPKTVANAGMSATLRGMTVTNLVQSGDFSDLSKWRSVPDNVEVENGIVKVTGPSTINVISIRQNNSLKTLPLGHKEYVRARLRVRDDESTRLRIRLYAGTTDAFVNDPDKDKWYDLSGIVTGTTSSANNNWQPFIFDSTYENIEATTGKVLEVEKPIHINLTELYGAGNEPSKEECDRLFSHYIDGTQSVKPQRVRATGKNLYPFDEINRSTLGNDDLKGFRVSLKKNIVYRLSMLPINATSWRYRFRIYKNGKHIAGAGSNTNHIIMNGLPNLLYADGNGVYLTGSDSTVNNARFILDDDYEVVFGISGGDTSSSTRISNVQIEVDNITPYETYNHTTRYMPPSLILNRLPNGVADTVEDGKFLQRVSDWYELKSEDITNVFDRTLKAQALIREILNISGNKVLGFDSNNPEGRVLFLGYSEIAYNINSEPKINSWGGAMQNNRIYIDLPLGTTLEQAREQLAGTKLLYQLAEPITHTLPPVGNLISHPKGSLIKECAVGEVGFYDDGLNVTNPDLPIERLDYIRIVDKQTGVETPLDISKAVVTAGGFTHPDISDGDLVNWDYYYPEKLSANGNVTYSYFDSRYAVMDDVTGKVYRYKPKVSNGELSFQLEEI